MKKELGKTKKLLLEALLLSFLIVFEITKIPFQRLKRGLSKLNCALSAQKIALRKIYKTLQGYNNNQKFN